MRTAARRMWAEISANAELQSICPIASRIPQSRFASRPPALLGETGGLSRRAVRDRRRRVGNIRNRSFDGESRAIVSDEAVLHARLGNPVPKIAGPGKGRLR